MNIAFVRRHYEAVLFGYKTYRRKISTTTADGVNVVSDADLATFFQSEARRHSQLMLLTKVKISLPA